MQLKHMLLAGVTLGSASALAQAPAVGGVPVPLPATIAAPLPSGTNALGSVGVTALPPLPAGSNAIGSIISTPSAYTSDFGPISVGTTTPVTIRAAGTHTLIFQVRGPAGSNLWLNLSGGTPVVGAGTFVPVGGQFQAPNGVTAAITGISDAGTLSVSGSAG